MTAKSSGRRSKRHWLGYAVCFVASAIALALAVSTDLQRRDFMAQWPDPYANPQAYGLPPEAAGLSHSELASRFGYDEAQRTVLERAGASSRYSRAQWQAQEMADRRDVFAIVAAALLFLPFLIHGLVHAIRRCAQQLEQAGRKAGPHLANATAVVIAKSRELSDNKVAISRGNLSTADELRKWADLRSEGLISEEEFIKMRTKILGR